MDLKNTILDALVLSFFDDPPVVPVDVASDLFFISVYCLLGRSFVLITISVSAPSSYYIDYIFVALLILYYLLLC